MEHPLQLVQSIIYGLFSLGILVFVHELGHFLIGRRAGIRVTTFSIGFGRGIFSFDRKGTHYKIGWIPIGGYCRFAGEGEDLGDDRKGEPDEFFERPPGARLATVSAGVLFNFIFALMIFTGLNTFGYSYTSMDNRITVVDKRIAPEADVFPALAAGLQSGDRILAVDGRPTASFARVAEEIATRPEQTLRLTIGRDGTTLEKTVTSSLRTEGAGFINIAPFVPAVIESVSNGMPAALAGLRSGDRIVSLDGEPVDSLPLLRALLQETKGRVVDVGLVRDGKAMSFRITPQLTPPETAEGQARYTLGFTAPIPELLSFDSERLALPAAFLQSFSQFGENIRRVVTGIRTLFHKDVQASKAVAGPARIIVISGTVMKESSFTGYLQFLAMISIALGFFNLLPIPAADGGHIVLIIIEKIRGKRFSFAVLRRIQMVGILLLGLIFVSVMMFDVMNLISG
jgi:regulator of sigma E protease